jgi:hypothetical protein
MNGGTGDSNNRSGLYDFKFHDKNKLIKQMGQKLVQLATNIKQNDKSNQRYIVSCDKGRRQTCCL